MANSFFDESFANEMSKVFNADYGLPATHLNGLPIFELEVLPA